MGLATCGATSLRALAGFPLGAARVLHAHLHFSYS